MIRDVVIVGGSPLGLMLACELRIVGVSVTVLERLVEPSGLSEPLRLGSRALVLLEQRGLLGRFSDQAQSFDLALALGGRTPHDLRDLKRDQSQILIIQQSRVEELLEERAIELGATLRWGHELVGLEQGHDSLRLEIRDPNGDYQLRTRFLVGCASEPGAARDLRRLTGVAEVDREGARRIFLASDSGFDNGLQNAVHLGRMLAAQLRGWSTAEA